MSQSVNIKLTAKLILSGLFPCFSSNVLLWLNGRLSIRAVAAIVLHLVVAFVARMTW